MAINDEEITDEPATEPNDLWPPHHEKSPAFDDPYAEDFVWNHDVSAVTDLRKSATVSDPYADTDDNRLESATNRAAADAVEEQRLSEFETFAPLPYTPESTQETVRKSGLAYSIGIVFVVSVAFMLLLGWIADWMFGTKPWGLVGGIVLGSIIGFVQVVRISSRILSTDKNAPALRPLMSHADEENDEVH